MHRHHHNGDPTDAVDNYGRGTLFGCTKCSKLTTDISHRCEQLPLGDMIAARCTSCGAPGWYSYGLNRYLHAVVPLPHGPCWLRNVQGRIDMDIERDNVRAMLRHERRRKTAA